ncbi:hypothetical protein QTP88_006026 [Uroleucon formosanum]
MGFLNDFIFIQHTKCKMKKTLMGSNRIPETRFVTTIIMLLLQKPRIDLFHVFTPFSIIIINGSLNNILLTVVWSQQNTTRLLNRAY